MTSLSGYHRNQGSTADGCQPVKCFSTGMAAQVEVQTGEVERIGVGGRLHLSPLSDSSNKRLTEGPCNTQASLIITPEPSKPVPAPKPRLTPRPFAVEKTPTIRPILAPKPNTNPRPVPTHPTSYKPDSPSTPKPQQPNVTSKHRPVPINPSCPAPNSYKPSHKLSMGQTTKPVAQPFKPAPLLTLGDPSKPTPSQPVRRQKPAAAGLFHSRCPKKPPSAEWSGSTKPEKERNKTASSIRAGAASMTRAKSMGFLSQIGQDEEERKGDEGPKVTVQLRSQSRASRPRPVSAIFLPSPTQAESPTPAARWAVRRPLSADLTSKFESIGLSLHHGRPAKTDSKENTPVEPLRRTEKEKGAEGTNVTPPAPDSKPSALVLGREKKTEEEEEEDDGKGGGSIKRRISLLLDSSSSFSPVVPLRVAAQRPGSNSPVQPIQEADVTLGGVKQRIRKLTEDTVTPPAQTPAVRPQFKSRPLPPDLTKRLGSERTTDLGSPSSSEATDRHESDTDPQRRVEDSVYSFSDQKKVDEDIRGIQEQPTQTTSDLSAVLTEAGRRMESCPSSGAQTVRAALFENVVERHSVLLMEEDRAQSATKGCPKRSVSLKLGDGENDGSLVTATYHKPVSPSSPHLVEHLFDTVQAVGESRAVSESVPLAQLEDKAMTLRSRRSEGNRSARAEPVEERHAQVQGVLSLAQRRAPASQQEQGPRYLRVGVLQKWNTTEMDREAEVEKGRQRDKEKERKEKERQREAERRMQMDVDREKPREQEREREEVAAPKRLKMLEPDEQPPKPRATYFALTGQIQEAVSYGDEETERGDVEVPFDDFSMKSGQWGSQGKVLQVRRNPSLDEAFGKSSQGQEEELMERNQTQERERGTAWDRRTWREELEIGKQKQVDLEKVRELEREKEWQRESKEFEREKQTRLDMERQKPLEYARKRELKLKELEREKHNELENERLSERQRELERQRWQELQRESQIELERQREQERQKEFEKERQRQLDLERQRQLDLERQKEFEKERQKEFEKERQRQLDLERQKEFEKERQRQLDLERQKEFEKERQRQLDLERQKEFEKERQRQLDLERQKEFEKERQRQLDLERQNEFEKERQRQLDLERQKEFEKERQRQLDSERQKEFEKERQRQLDSERQKEFEKERQRQLDLERQKEFEKERQRQLDLERQKEFEKERQRQLDLERQKEFEKERQRQLDLERQKEFEKERQRQLDLERQKEFEKERQRQLDLERQKEFEKERQRQLDLERQKEFEEERQRQLDLERQKEFEKERQRQLDLERQKEFEKERQRQLDLERQKEFEKERQRQLDLERQKEFEKERQRQLDLERQKEFEKERQRQLDLERQKEFEKERQRQLDLERQKEFEKERQRQLDLERQKEFEKERQRQLDLERQKEFEKERQRQLDLERQKEFEKERQRQLDLERQKEFEKERQRQLDLERQKEFEKERQRQLDLERQKKLDKERTEELERIKEMERRQMFEKQKQNERGRQQLLELEKQRQRERMEREEQEKMRQQAIQQEEDRQRELERERVQELERQRQRDLERQKQRELERQKQLDFERQELENQRDRKRELERERQRIEELERIKEMERRQLFEFEKQKQNERERQLLHELGKQRLREKMEREEQEKMRHVAIQEEAERQRIMERQRRENQERGVLDFLPLRPKMLDLDSGCWSLGDLHSRGSPHSPSVRWKQPSPWADDHYRPGILDIDSFRSQTETQPLPTREVFPVTGIQGSDPGSGVRSHPHYPKREGGHRMAPEGAVGRPSTVWAPSQQELWEQRLSIDEESVDRPMAGPEPPRKPANKPSLEQLLHRLEDRATAPILVPERRWSGMPSEPSFPRRAPQSPGSPMEQTWFPQDSEPQGHRVEARGQRRSQGSQELNRMRSRSVSRRSAPSECAMEGSLSRMRSRSVSRRSALSASAMEGSLSRIRSRSTHRERGRQSWEQLKQNVDGEEGRDMDTLVRETDSQYGTWETGLHTDDSLTPATPPSDSHPSQSPRKPTPLYTSGEHVHTPPSDHDTPDGFSAQPEIQPLPFPEASTSLLDSSALRSRVQLSKMRGPRSRPSRVSRQTAALSVHPEGQATPTEDWRSRDSTEDKVESSKKDSDSEEQARGADPRSAAASSQPQRVALFPGMDPSALMAQLKKRSDSDNQTEGPATSPSQLSRSPKSPFLPRASRVLPPSVGKENGEEASPQWLRELKSKKRLSQYENDS